ncbi:hypothetical protein AB0877_08050 [Micromonospora sp. NPDC047644]
MSRTNSASSIHDISSAREVAWATAPSTDQGYGEWPWESSQG